MSNKLFKPPNFFTMYDYYIAVKASAANNDDHLEWYGLVESKIRLLLCDLEWKPFIEQAQIRVERGSVTSRWYIGLKFANSENLTVDLSCDIQQFTETVYRQAVASKMYKQGMKLKAMPIKRDQAEYIPANLLGIKHRKKETTEVGKTSPPVISLDQNSQNSNCSSVTRSDLQLVDKDGCNKENSSPGNVADSLGKVSSDSSDAGSDGPISAKKKRPSYSSFDASLKRVRAEEENSNSSDGYDVVTLASDGEEEKSEIMEMEVVNPISRLYTPSAYTSRILMEVFSPNSLKGGFIKRIDLDYNKLETIYRAVKKKYPDFTTSLCNRSINVKLGHLREDWKKKRPNREMSVIEVMYKKSQERCKKLKSAFEKLTLEKERLQKTVLKKPENNGGNRPPPAGILKSRHIKRVTFNPCISTTASRDDEQCWEIETDRSAPVTHRELTKENPDDLAWLEGI